MMAMKVDVESSCSTRSISFDVLTMNRRAQMFSVKRGVV